MQVLIPKRELDPTGNVPVFFLAGPVRGGGDWQADMCRILAREVPDCICMVPCRWDAMHPLSAYLVGEVGKRFRRQLEWEQHYLALAGVHHPKGCIVFWLPSESKAMPHPGPEPYAMDTRGELGEWRMRMKYEGARVVIGGEPAFLGLSQVQRNYSVVLGCDFPIHPSLEATAAVAIRYALGASR